MKTATVRARIEPQLKQNVETILHLLGLSLSEAIEMFLAQINLKKGIPFDVSIPNEVTIETFKKTDQGKELKQYKHAKLDFSHFPGPTHEKTS